MTCLHLAFMGPNTPVANGTLLGSVQAQGDYMSKVRPDLKHSDRR